MSRGERSERGRREERSVEGTRASGAGGGARVQAVRRLRAWCVCVPLWWVREGGLGLLGVERGRWGRRFLGSGGVGVLCEWWVCVGLAPG